MENNTLEQFAIALARPAFCEVVLHRFLTRVKLECKTEQDVRDLYRAIRTAKKADNGRLKLVQQ